MSLLRPPAVRPLRLLQATAFVSTLDRFAMPPLLLAISVDMEAPLAAVVSAAGVYFLVYGLCQPVWGAVADRFGRVRTMRVTLLIAGLSTLAATLVGSPTGLGVARGFAGGFFGAAYPSTLIYIGDTVPAAVRQRDIAGLMVGVAIATAVASVGAGVLADLASWRVAFVITGTTAILLAWGLRRLPEPPTERRRGSPLAPLAEVARSRATLFVLTLAFVEGGVLLGALTLLPPAVEDAGSAAALAGAVIGAYGVAVYLFAWLVGRLSQRWHPAGLIGLGGGAAALGCAILAGSRTPVSAVVVAVLLGLAWTAMHSSLQTWATEVLPDARAAVVSLFAASLFVGSAVAAVLVAGLADEGRYDLIYAGYGALAVPLAVAAAYGRRRWRRPALTALEGDR